jgi:hypothetical protein
MRCCFDCYYFQPEGKGSADELEEKDWNGGVLEGECRRRTPNVGMLLEQAEIGPFHHYGEWPRVLAADWCGEFLSKHGVEAERLRLDHGPPTSRLVTVFRLVDRTDGRNDDAPRANTGDSAETSQGTAGHRT